jgi:hypothetical protein
MTHRGWICLLLGSLAWGQANSTPAGMPQKPAGAEASAPFVSSVPPDATVITIQGVCDNPPADKGAMSDCKTVITRAQFDLIVEAVAPTMSAAARKQLANQYAVALAMVQKAHEMGVDKGPIFEERVKLSRIGVITKGLNQAMQEQAGQVPDKDVEEYYKNNLATYSEFDLQRVFVPKTKQLPPSKIKLTPAQTEKQQKDAEAAMKAEAEALRARALKGEAFSKLQAEAFQVAGQKNKPPSTDMGKMRHNSLPPNHASVMDLKTGEVSVLIAEPTGYFFYKMGEKDTVPLDKVKDEIHNTLRGQRMKEATEALQHSVTPTLNDAYFGAPAAETPAGMTPMPKPPAKPDSPEPK